LLHTLCLGRNLGGLDNDFIIAGRNIVTFKFSVVSGDACRPF
jgi:hypothetical protein